MQLRKVLVVCEYATLNGGERSLLTVLPRLRDMGFEFVVAGPSQGDLRSTMEALNVECAPFDVHRSDGVRTSRGQMREQLRRIIAQHSPGLVHANSLSMSRLCGPVAKDEGVAGIGHLRDIVNISRQAMADINCNSRVLAVSHAARDWHIARGLAADRSHVVYNGIDEETFRPRPRTGWLHRAIGAPPDAPLIISIGQIGLRKGCDVLLRAARLVLRSQPAARFLLVGERMSQKEEACRFEEDLHSLADSDDLRGSVHFLGWRDDVALILNEATLLVHAARQEPLGRVLLEAAASATPIVATDVGGTREIFPEPDCGALLVSPDEPAGLAAAICQILGASSASRRQMGEAARHSVTQKFSPQRAAEQLREHYLAAGEVD